MEVDLDLEVVMFVTQGHRSKFKVKMVNQLLVFSLTEIIRLSLTSCAHTCIALPIFLSVSYYKVYIEFKVLIPCMDCAIWLKNYGVWGPSVQ